jgi:hypothetical protein
MGRKKIKEFKVPTQKVLQAKAQFLSEALAKSLYQIFVTEISLPTGQAG